LASRRLESAGSGADAGLAEPCTRTTPPCAGAPPVGYLESLDSPVDDESSPSRGTNTAHSGAICTHANKPHNVSVKTNKP